MARKFEKMWLVLILAATALMLWILSGFATDPPQKENETFADENKLSYTEKQDGTIRIDG